METLGQIDDACGTLRGRTEPVGHAITIQEDLMKHSTIIAAAVALAISAGGAAVATASSPQQLPTLKLALTGTKGIAVSGSPVSGAVDVVSTFTGKAGANGADAAIFRLGPGVTMQQVLRAVKHNADPNAVTPYGSIVYDASAPTHTQVVLTAGNYIALNVSGNGAGGAAPFTVTESSSPAALPAAAARQSAIEFAFRGPTTLHDGTIIRAQNQGYLVHMIDAIGVPSRVAGRKLIALLLAGRDRTAMRLSNRHFINLLGPASHGAVQQSTLQAAPGWYVEACFMDTQDGREHTRLGMERLIRVVK